MICRVRACTIANTGGLIQLLPGVHKNDVELGPHTECIVAQAALIMMKLNSTKSGVKFPFVCSLLYIGVLTVVLSIAFMPYFATALLAALRVFLSVCLSVRPSVSYGLLKWKTMKRRKKLKLPKLV